MPSKGFSDGYFAGADHVAHVFVIDAAELSGGYALDGFWRMDDVQVSLACDGAVQEMVDMAYLEGDVHAFAFLEVKGLGDCAEICQFYQVSVLQLGVPAACYEDDVLAYVLLDDKPRASCQVQAFALADGVEPESLVCAQDAVGLDVDYLAFLFAEELAQEIVVVDFAQEAYSLAVLALGAGQMGVEGYLTDLVLHKWSEGADELAYLCVGELCEEVGLVLDGVLGCPQVVFAVLFIYGGVVSGGDVVVLVADFFFECSELDELVAHYVGIGGEALFDALDGISDDAFPVFLLQVDDLQFKPVLVCSGGRELDVFLGSTAGVLAFHAYLDVVQVGLESVAAQQVCDDAAVHASADEQGNLLVLEFIVVYGHLVYFLWQKYDFFCDLHHAAPFSVAEDGYDDV